MEKQQNQYEQETKKLMSTVERLDTDINELMIEFKKQNSTLKDNEDNLKLQTQALLKDREMFVEQSKWEQERFQVHIQIRY